MNSNNILSSSFIGKIVHATTNNNNNNTFGITTTTMTTSIPISTSTKTITTTTPLTTTTTKATSLTKIANPITNMIPKCLNHHMDFNFFCLNDECLSKEQYVLCDICRILHYCSKSDDNIAFEEIFDKEKINELTGIDIFKTRPPNSIKLNQADELTLQTLHTIMDKFENEILDLLKLIKDQIKGILIEQFSKKTEKMTQKIQGDVERFTMLYSKFQTQSPRSITNSQVVEYIKNFKKIRDFVKGQTNQMDNNPAANDINKDQLTKLVNPYLNSIKTQFQSTFTDFTTTLSSLLSKAEGDEVQVQVIATAAGKGAEAGKGIGARTGTGTGARAGTETETGAGARAGAETGIRTGTGAGTETGAGAGAGVRIESGEGQEAFLDESSSNFIIVTKPSPTVINRLQNNAKAKQKPKLKSIGAGVGAGGIIPIEAKRPMGTIGGTTEGSMGVTGRPTGVTGATHVQTKSSRANVENEKDSNPLTERIQIKDGIEIGVKEEEAGVGMRIEAGAGLKREAGARIRGDAGPGTRGEAGAGLKREAGARIRGEAGARTRGEVGAGTRGDAGIEARGEAGTGTKRYAGGEAGRDVGLDKVSNVQISNMVLPINYKTINDQQYVKTTSPLEFSPASSIKGQQNDIPTKRLLGQSFEGNLLVKQESPTNLPNLPQIIETPINIQDDNRSKNTNNTSNSLRERKNQGLSMKINKKQDITSSKKRCMKEALNNSRNVSMYQARLGLTNQSILEEDYMNLNNTFTTNILPLVDTSILGNPYEYYGLSSHMNSMILGDKNDTTDPPNDPHIQTLRQENIKARLGKSINEEVQTAGDDDPHGNKYFVRESYKPKKNITIVMDNRMNTSNYSCTTQPYAQNFLSWDT